LSAYVASPDPRVAATNWVAILVALNQPFYPLWIRGFVGDDGWVSTLIFLSTPFFAVIPAVSRRASLAGQAMLPLVGTANTMLSAKAFGSASGVELFLFPCAMAAAMAFRARERGALLTVLGIVAGAFLILHDRMGPPLPCVFQRGNFAIPDDQHLERRGPDAADRAAVFRSRRRLGAA
jgi:hypothetical protein